MTEIGRKSPLLKMTSAAYGVGRDSVAEATAECCQARFFLKPNVNRGATEEKYGAWHAPFEGFGRSRSSASASVLPIDQRGRP